MGSCFSCDYSGSKSMITCSAPTAKVISIKGELHEYPIPITAAQVLQSESHAPSSFFVCNSDKLYFDDYIPPLDSTELLQPNQIYFLLPTARLQYPLTASDMATLAVKASTALLDCSKQMDRRRRKKIQILPIVDMNPSDGPDHDGEAWAFKKFDDKAASATSSRGLSRSGSVRKLHKSASRRAKVVYRSFRTRLSTIHENEGSVTAAHQ